MWYNGGDNKNGISTHALTWRATRMAESATGSGHDFYPRPHVEGDAKEELEQAKTKLISTHALTWRATQRCHRRGEGCPDFYPRPHVEGDIR